MRFQRKVTPVEVAVFDGVTLPTGADRDEMGNAVLVTLAGRKPLGGSDVVIYHEHAPWEVLSACQFVEIYEPIPEASTKKK